MNRRDFLKLTLAAAAAGIPLGRFTLRPLLSAPPTPPADDVGAARSRPSPGLAVRGPARVAILRAATYDAPLASELRRLVAASFPDLAARAKGARVLLKPNLVEWRAGAPVNTHPAVVGAAIELFRSLGAREVLVGEGPGHMRDAVAVAEAAGVLDVLRSERVRFVDLNHDAVRDTPLATRRSRLGSLALPETALGADLVVSLAKMKTHHWTGATLSMKNLFGLVPGAVYGFPKNVLHFHGIDACIVDIAATIRPAFAIVDGVVGMEGDGPIMGRPVPSGALILGELPASVDATAARLMGLAPARIPHIAMAPRILGPTAELSIEQVGETIACLARDYDPGPFATSR